MEQLNKRGFGFGPRAGTATHYSVTRDGEREAIPEGILTGPPYALVLGEITRVNRELDLGKLEVGIGRSKGRNATEYIGNQVDKGCLVAVGSTRAVSQSASQSDTKLVYSTRMRSFYIPGVRRTLSAITTVADGRLECWAVLKIATSSYGQRLCSQ